ncbi:long-chain fatty acid transport protein, outer membrane protein [Fulvivirga imtechensis AK7]|uniref:Long-chain fatty acid transport protein, outer membrane protein n=1 Tax=Fulvivirga imtechensis AK7 TaxID=1237149 RepID=L8K027_9BACT|nr:outer membrane protein transport protein [Fulvivirga imtechensis]ELR73284.1 long-chain fatty acid transport protein, outer membrane protein [Fulvivirga imtechensis AK7]
MKKLFTTFIFLAAASVSWANGYQVLLQAARAIAMGNIGVPFATSSSVFWNPGALGIARHSTVEIGFAPIFSRVQYYASDIPNSTYTAETDNPIGTPFYLYAVWAREESPLRLAIGVYTPYGSSVNWESGWRGDVLLDEIGLESVYVQPTIAYKLTDKLSIGGGVVYAIGFVNLQRQLPISSEDVDPSVELNGNASGWGYNLGILFQPSQRWSIGLNYRSKVSMTLKDGDATFAVPQSLRVYFPEGNTFDTTLPLPDNIALGVAWHTNERLTLAAQVTRTGWNAYKELAFDFAINTDRLQDTHSPRNYENSYSYNVGAEYALNPVFTLRAGYYFDESPVRDGYLTPETPSSDRNNFTAGVGIAVTEQLNVDLSFLYISAKERTQTQEDVEQAGTYDPETGEQGALPGTYRFNAFIPGISISYKFNVRQ